MAASQTSLTYNQIISTFETFATDHKQINEFKYGTLADINSFSDLKYISLWVIPQPSQLKEYSLELRFYFLFVDMVQPDLSNLLEVHSDTLTVALDFVAYFKENWDIDVSVNSLTPFQDRLDDSLAGWNLDATITLASFNDLCSIPLD